MVKALALKPDHLVLALPENPSQPAAPAGGQPFPRWRTAWLVTNLKWLVKRVVRLYHRRGVSDGPTNRLAAVRSALAAASAAAKANSKSPEPFEGTQDVRLYF
jgi:hypothetical protein